MTTKLLLEVAKGSVDVNAFINWLLANKADEYRDQLNFKCSRTDFITNFLNLIHEELLGNKEQFSQKCTPSQKLDKQNDEISFDRKRTNLERDCLSKSTSFPLDKSIEKALNDANQENISVSPNLFKIHSDSIINASFSSPLSPIYQKQSDFLTPKNKRYSVSQKSNEKVPQLCLNDFIVSTPVNKKKCKKGYLNDEPVRRITPTILHNEKGCDFRKTSNCFDNFNTKEVSFTNFNENRNFLVEEGRTMSGRSSNENNITLVSRKLSVMFGSNQGLDAKRSYVSNECELNNIARIYIAILSNSLVLNLTSEINFLINLLVKKNFCHIEERHNEGLQNSFKFLTNISKDVINIENNITSTSCYFSTIHNIIYFVVKCLESQIDVLRYFDRTTLILLSDNPRLKTFSKNFSEELRKISETKSDRIVELSDDSQQINVCFNLDTDNRANFPTEVTFHSFRKQRDLFYEILRIWEVNHLQSGWSFSVGLGGKIKSLLNIGDPTNYLHFCRLFKDQLLSTCGKNLKNSDISENDFSFLSSLPNVDAGKLNRLKNRLVTKQSCNGLNSLPMFMGYEEFYKEFIVVASNYVFNKHLCDTLIANIIELNETNFPINDYGDSDVDNSTKKSFTTCLIYLKVLAKFLGFVESLPYRSDLTCYSENVLLAHISIRKQISPSLDIKQIIIRSMEQRHVLLTVSWITEYLAMLDFITLRLPYYISVHKKLFQLYRNYNHSARNCPYNSALVKFSLGWLFELPHFPDTEFFTHLEEVDRDDVVEIRESKDNMLDDIAIVDQNILYSFCSYLEEIKKLLLTDVSNNTTVKHITPVTTIQSGEEINKKKLEYQLEEAFFNGQPVSVRKTVEFVCERIASACVKHICHDIVPEFKRTSLRELDIMLKSFCENGEYSKDFLKIRVAKMAQSYLKSLKEHCSKSASDIMRDKIPPCIDSLLAMDTLSQTKNTCISITARMCKDRVKQWNNSHINISIFTKDFDLEIQKMKKEDNKKSSKSKPLFALPSVGNREKHDDTCLSAADLMESIKRLSLELLENSHSVKEEVVLDVLSKASVTLSERCDVNESINSYVCSLLVDFSLLLVVHRSDITDNEVVLRQFVKVWNEFYGKSEELFKHLLCARNITLMAQTHQDKTVWSNLAKFVAFLIKANILSCDNFEFQCTSFYQKDWDEVTLQNVSIFLSKFIEFYKKDGGSMDKFTFLLEFLSGFCLDL